jgi:hypothetical protein
MLIYFGDSSMSENRGQNTYENMSTLSIVASKFFDDVNKARASATMVATTAASEPLEISSVSESLPPTTGPAAQSFSDPFQYGYRINHIDAILGDSDLLEIGLGLGVGSAADHGMGAGNKLGRIVPLIQFLQGRAFKEEFFTESLRTNFLVVMSQVEEEMIRAMTVNSSGLNGPLGFGIDVLYKVTARLLGKSVGKLPVTDDTRLIYESGFVLLYLLLTENVPQQDGSISAASAGSCCVTSEAFLTRYPEFRHDARIDDRERANLLRFRNMMVICQRVIPAQGHKNHLIDIVTRLVEGKHVKYIVGSGQSDKTSRRVFIYRREGNVPLVPKGTMDGCFVVPGGNHLTNVPNIVHTQHNSSEGVDATDTESDLSNRDSSTASTASVFLAPGMPFAAGVARSGHTDSTQPQRSSMYKIEKKRNKHLTYLESMTRRRDEQFGQLRCSYPGQESLDASTGKTFEVIVRTGDSFKILILENVLAIHPVMSNDAAPLDPCTAVTAARC